MSFWTRFFNWCRRPDMIKIQRFNPGIGEKYVRNKPLQTGISIIMGWTIWLVCVTGIQNIQPGRDEAFMVAFLLVLGLTSWGIIQKGNRMGKILLQTGVVATIIWVFTAASAYDLGNVLGLPKLHITAGHFPDGTPIHMGVFPLVIIGGFPVLGLILVASGIMSLTPRKAVILVTLFIILATSYSYSIGWRYQIVPHVAKDPLDGYTFINPEDVETLTITTDTNLTEDYTGMIVIAADGVTLDGDGHMIIGSGPDVYILNPNIDPKKDSNWMEKLKSTKGILLEGRTGVTVKNCRVTNFTYGFHLNGSDENTLQGNTANNNGIGFELDWSDGNILRGNTANNNTDGFLLVWSDGNNLEANTANNNSFMGFSLCDSDGNSLEANTANENFACGFFSQPASNNTFRENTANGNYDGFYFDMSFGNTIQGNTANNNTNGFRFCWSDENSVEANTANDNTQSGFYVGCSSDNTLTGNTISNNTSGMYFGGACSINNSIYHNDFVNNIKQANITNPDTVNAWDDGYPSGGNYWSDYTGVDTNGDGIGDTPYVIDDNNMDRYPLMAPFS